MSPETVFLISVMTGVAAVLMVSHMRHVRAQRVRLLAEAAAQFEQLDVRSDDSRFGFRGATAQVLEEETRFISSAGMPVRITLTRFCRNDAGEHFLFVSNSDRAPFLKHVPQHLARIRLKTKYVAPLDIPKTAEPFRD